MTSIILDRYAISC